MTIAAKKFLEAVSESWDTPHPWIDTAKLGLSEYDEDALRGFCEKTGEQYRDAVKEVMKAIRSHAKSA